MPRSTHRIAHSLAVAALLLALGAVGCGDSDEGGSEEDRARATVERLYAAIRAGDADGVCATMTKPAQRQVAEGAIGVGKARTCAGAFQQFLDEAERRGGLDLTLKAKVEAVEVTGDKAVAKVSFGGKRTGDIPLVERNGQWRLDQAGTTPAR